MSFNTSSNTARIATTIRIEKKAKHETGPKGSDKTSVQEIWAKAKHYAHDRLWFDYVLPGLLEEQGVDTRKMSTSERVQAIADLWEAKQYEVNGQLSVTQTFTHEDDLSEGYEGECPTKWDAATETRVPVTLNALATIGSNDFRYYVMKGDEWTSPLVPDNCFFGTYPVKYKGEIQKGKFRCVLKVKK
ncbi:MAG: hypothetical protein CBB97_02570 [Candidatus Endolissoclinum sp. TMED37]|nr:MAG: hypothetical protein CBB97_02570 [Candidatus Endolissoclinum sp. TMED37]